MYILCLGDSCVGKSSVIKRVCGQTFPNKYTKTHGFERFELPDRNVYLIDTGDVTPDVVRILLLNVIFILIIYDLTNEQTYHNALKIQEIYKKYPTLLVGNKLDLVQKEKGEYCVSAKNGQGFEKIINKIFYEKSKKNNCRVN